MLESKINFIELTKSEINKEFFNKSNIKSYNNKVFYTLIVKLKRILI